MMFMFDLEFTVPAEKRADVVNTLQDSLITPTIDHAGCLRYRLSSDTENDDRLFLFGLWESQDALEQHIRSDAFRIILGILEVSVENPKMGFHKVSSTKGMDFVERIRS